MSQETVFVGLDVSKARLDVRVLGEAKARACVNAPAGWVKLIDQMRGLGRPVCVGVEPSGGYEKGVVAALVRAGIDVRWANPDRVRSLARGLGAPAKTDAIDADMIARFVAHTGGHPVELDDARQDLRELLIARTAAQEAAQRLTAQARMLEPGPARDALERLAAQAREQAAALEAAALERVREPSSFKGDWKLLQTAPGVGPLVAAGLLAEMPELGRVSPRAAAKLAGLAPFVRKSGTWNGRAVCSGGRPRPRRLLYLATMAAVRCCPEIRAAFQNLVARGKPKMVALVACMRKLLTILNAMLRDQRPWSPVMP